MTPPQSERGLARGVRRAWSLVGTSERKQLRRVALYGVLIAGLDTFGLVLVYALITILNKQSVGGVAGSVVRVLGVDGSDRYRVALVLLAITSALFIARSLLSVLVLWLTVGAANEAQVELVGRLLSGFAQAPQLIRLERNSSGTLRTTMSSIAQVVGGVVFSSVSLVSNAAVAAAVALGLVLASPVVAIAASIYFALITWLWVRVARRGLTQRGREQQGLTAELYRFVMQGLSAAKELQLRGRALFYVDEAVTRTRGINAATRILNVANGSLRYMLETSLVLGAALVVAVAGITGGRESVLPAVGLVLAGAFRLLPALNQILFLTNSIQFGYAAIDIVEREVELVGPYATPAAKPRKEAPEPHRLEREVQLEDVWFRYPTREEPALRGVACEIFAGESFGIVGPTGSGKSTLLDIILGILDPERGTVLVDGAPLALGREAWQSSIGYVPQDVYLVDDTLRANVALGWYGQDVDEERVCEAIRLAELEAVVAALPQGLSTRVGERGVRLSGGQRQRVGLARALYTRPSVLVLDEATSNLDQVTERQVVSTLSALRGGVTTIVVTHRVASVRNCDRILYLDGGAVRVVGDYEAICRSVPDFDTDPAAPALSAVRTG